MNFTLKALVVAAALVAAGSANAALVSGADTGSASDNGKGELFLSVVDTVTRQAFVFDFTPVAGNTFDMNSFTVGSSAAAQNYSWNVSGAATWSSFATAAGSHALVWSVAGIDAFVDYDVADNTTPGQEGVVITVNNTKTSADIANLTQGALDGAITKTGLADVYVNPQSSAADPAVIVGGGNWDSALGSTFGGNLISTVNNVGDAASFVYLTGAGNGANTTATAYAGKFTFAITGANAVLSYNVPTANVPESDTYAMLLAGLGVMGFVARRRLA